MDPEYLDGVTVENESVINRIDHLRKTTAAVKFLSIEPLLGSLPALDLTGIDWVIVGVSPAPALATWTRHGLLTFGISAVVLACRSFSSNGGK
jgi:protein gp37